MHVRRCKTCAHPERAAIETELHGPRPLHEIGQQFGLSKSALWRHWRRHMAKASAHLVSPSAAELARAIVLELRKQLG
jgi:hypothetical protein